MRLWLQTPGETAAGCAVSLRRSPPVAGSICALVRHTCRRTRRSERSLASTMRRVASVSVRASRESIRNRGDARTPCALPAVSKMGHLIECDYCTRGFLLSPIANSRFWRPATSLLRQFFPAGRRGRWSRDWHERIQSGPLAEIHTRLPRSVRDLFT